MSFTELDRLQGTDGIRSKVAPAAEFSKNPLTVYLEHGVITEEFFELYCYAHVADLIERGKMKEGDEILIGWDSRDTEGFYTSKAVSGISKAGGKPMELGVLPTPGVALALVKRGSAGALMITASHNPKDQNGIKIFLAPNALKMLPGDDRNLTAKILNLDYETVRNAAQRYESVSLAEEGQKSFCDFHLDPRNSFLSSDDGVEKAFSRITLVVDSAHGAMSMLAPKIFRLLGFSEVIEVACELNGRVNENSGVAFLEGVKEIDAKKLAEEPGLAKHQLVKKMLEEGRNRKESFAGGGSKLMGVAFDADGDRFFILVYSPLTDAVKILSGDETAALQAEYLMRESPDRYRDTMFVCTVESDINVARHAASLGFKPVVTAVGDKWILQKAVEAGENFGIGTEETGHSIHRGLLSTDGGGEKSLFAGNGLKGAINTLVAAVSLGETKTAEQFDEWIGSPFEPGFKKSVYAYYVDKNLFRRESSVWGGLEKLLRDAAVSDGGGLSLVESELEAEPDMLYIRIEKGGETVGTLFARNSGTENKISVNARGAIELETFLSGILEQAVAFLMAEMKDKSDPMALAEAKLLEELYNGCSPEAGSYEGVNFDRLVFEMEIKQKLIKRNENGFEITSLGRKLVG